MLDKLKILSDIVLNIPARPLNNAQMWRVLMKPMDWGISVSERSRSISGSFVFLFTSFQIFAIKLKYF